MKTYIIPTSSAEHIGAKLRKKSNYVLPLGKNNDGKNKFPDGEVFASIPKIQLLQGERVVILHSGMPNPNDGLMELKYILDILNEPTEVEDRGNKSFKYKELEKPASIEVFFTYFPYGRHDKPFVTGGVNEAKGIMKNLVNNYAVNRICAIDLHCGDADWLNTYHVKNISANNELIAALKYDGYSDIISVAPDIGAQLRLGISGLKKERKNSNDVTMQLTQDLDIEGKTVVVKDDMIGTGGTMAKAYDIFKKLGAKKVIAAATHGVIPEGVQRVKEAYNGELYFTDTIDQPEANVGITELVWNTINNN